MICRLSSHAGPMRLRIPKVFFDGCTSYTLHIPFLCLHGPSHKHDKIMDFDEFIVGQMLFYPGRSGCV